MLTVNNDINDKLQNDVVFVMSKKQTFKLSHTIISLISLSGDIAYEWIVIIVFIEIIVVNIIKNIKGFIG